MPVGAETILNFIHGEFVPPRSGKFLENFEPATGRSYSKVPDSDERDVQEAVETARRAFPKWASTSVKKRSDILLDISKRIENSLEELAQAETVDTGKPLSLSRSLDIPRAASNLHFFATAILHTSTEAFSTGQSAINYVDRKPLGVVGCISPWNLPLYLFTWKIAPALAVGNCVVAKPSELAPMTAYLLCKICKEAGLPPGVLNVVHGTGPKVGAAITRHPQILAISFTGGTKTGAEIASVAAPMFKRLSLELGGKNPNLIFADADFDEMLESTIRSSFLNQGEICLSSSRLIVERSMYDRFRDAFVSRARKLRVGDPLENNVDQGALISSAHLEKVTSYVQIARKEGARILCGGEPIRTEGRTANGWYFAPTVIEGSGPELRINQEEIFGPVVTLLPFDSEAEAVDIANGTPFGLAAMIWTRDLSRAHRVASLLEAGIVWVNCWLLRDLRTPFGGMKSFWDWTRRG